MTEMDAKIHTAVVTEELVRARLDKALATLLPELSRTRLKALMQEGNVTNDGTPVCDPSIKVKEGQVFKVKVPEAIEPIPKPENIPLNILFEDDDLIVIDKPAGLVVHPAPGHYSGTLVNALLHHCGDSLSGIGGVRRPGIVHRLDKDTSGVMVVAKNDKSHQHLSDQFSKHTLTRKYKAIVTGVPHPHGGRIETLIARNPKHRQKMAVSKKKGKEARTIYQVCQVLPWTSIVECTLETGRTHQVRVHMAEIGHPLIGDQLYSRGRIPKALRGKSAETAIKNFKRQALHAFFLSFTHPTTKEIKSFQSPIPSDMEALVKALKA